MKTHLAPFLLALLSFACSSSGEGSPTYQNSPDELVDDGMSGDPNTPSTPTENTNVPSTTVPDPGDPVDACPPDPCPAENGVTWRCRDRFVYGTNMAWEEFGADFGGIERWGRKSISEDPLLYSSRLEEMKAHGVNVIRWWMFPDFRGDGIRFENGMPTGITQKVLDDVSTALELAAAHDVYLMLTLFSFDGFKPNDGSDPEWPTYLTPISLDSSLRGALAENVVRPIAAHVEAHEHAVRMHSWDIINEPEWAVSGASLYGDDRFTGGEETDPISHGEMEQFLAELNVVLRQESSALISVGGSLKWPNAWTGLDVDFHQLHYYPWMEQYYSLDRPLSKLGPNDGKPVILGEFPGASRYLADSPFDYSEYLELLERNGWAGALGWDWGSSTPADKDAVLTYAEQNSCTVAY